MHQSMIDCVLCHVALIQKMCVELEIITGLKKTNWMESACRFLQGDMGHASDGENLHPSKSCQSAHSHASHAYSTEKQAYTCCIHSSM